MISKTNCPTKLDNFQYKRVARVSALNKPESLFSRSWIANIMLLVFCVADFITIYTVWNQLLTESPLMLNLIVVAFVICLDVTMSISGNVLKQNSQGLRNKKDTVFIVSVCASSFFVAYLFYLLLRISMKDMMFGDVGITSALVDMTNQTTTLAADNTGNNIIAWFATLALAVSPLATSLASLGVSYAVSDPLQEKITDCEKARVELQTHITSLKKILVEAEDVDTHMQQLYNREDDLYDAFMDSIDRSSLALQMKVRTILMEKIGKSDADKITDLTEECNRKLAESINTSSNLSTSMTSGECSTTHTPNTFDNPTDTHRKIA